MRVSQISLYILKMLLHNIRDVFPVQCIYKFSDLGLCTELFFVHFFQIGFRILFPVYHWPV
jgi:hypothetical protein